jgi:glycine cleavage system H lipoate-binding protein
MVAIFVILTIVAFVVADSLIRRAEAKRLQPALAPTGFAIAGLTLEGVTVPGGVFVDTGHTWVELDASGTSRIGMDDFAQRAMGRIDEVKLPAVGQEVHRGEKLFAIRQGERTATFNAPTDGVVSSVNYDLAHHPEAIKVDAYEQGWICSLRPKNLANNLKQLFIAEEARAWINEEIRRFQEFIAARPIENMALGHLLQDGGQPTDGVLELMDDETWHLFTSEFLHCPMAESEPE